MKKSLEELKNKYGAISILISTRERPTEVALLLQSLRTQIYNEYNVYIVDDASGTLLNNYHFFNCMVNMMKIEGHNIVMQRNNFNMGVSKARQACVDLAMNNGSNEKLFLRVDDDVILEPDYILKLVETIDEGWDLASGVTIAAMNAPLIRETKYVKPIINEVILNNNGDIIENSDDCGIEYLTEEIILAPHFRSCALYKREIHEAGVDYNSNLSKYGFREEEVFSFKIILAGFKMAVNTKAKNYHLLCPSGGERVGDANELTFLNEKILKDFTKRKFEEKGNFIQEYYEKNNVKPKGHSKTNLILEG